MSDNHWLPGESIITAKNCRACGNPIEPFMSLGSQPLPQASDPPSRQHSDALRYELAPAACGECGLVQLTAVPRPEVMFQKDYPYFTGTSQFMSEHLRSWAESLLQQVNPTKDPFFVEIGTNDGTLLRDIARRGVRHLGIEPAGNVASAALANGVTVLESFFSAQTARQIQGEGGQADIIVAANVIAHIPSVMDIADGIAQLLKRDGLFTFEAIYLGDVVSKNMFDQIYAEHVFTFSVRAVRNIFAASGLELIDVQHQDTHGGSMRYTLAHAGRRRRSESVSRAEETEANLGLNDSRTYLSFAKRSYLIRDRVKELLVDLRDHRYRIAGYGATAKGTTLLNWCGIDLELLEFVSDCTPAKQGRLMPGTSIPIRSPQHFADNKPDYTLLLAWNHRAEIERREAQYRRRGGKWILYIPEVSVA